MPLKERMAREKNADGDVLKAQKDFFRELNGGLASLPAAGASGGVTVTAPNGQTYTFPNAQAAQEFKKKAGIQ